ncbi:3-deoxy-7-phosphoheptulonate synthase [Myxococcus sp. CA040A]|uniref:3-deoxy-7-phosphoheptulonate synthase n=1 Tax=Myxococcus sp. CA033 TaxID=2741516 RepID=UPI00157B36D3|nr:MULTISPECIES: 3-deoxy-7-phosphoheptulonate synthase [unclassified Myxococcus]NTX06975.1 3-deoxy-7-phosphoheptulonate synthase [Myxococcus sp. CA040A]NTX38605.1 3-deoxy-7-phosphoheptulonate synthase [Myxococcus sp. CA033]
MGGLVGGKQPDESVPANAGKDTGARRVLRAFRPEGTRVRAGSVEVGGPGFVVMAGPCAVEGVEQVDRTAAAVAQAGAHVLRGGVFKPRTSPYAFQGMGEPGLQLLADTGRRHGLPIISEVMETAQIPFMAESADILQVGARNMQNFSLLRALGKIRRPVLLKRGLSATVQEWLLAAEYILEGGNEQVLLCERGIRTFETEMRNTLDLAAVAWAKQRTHLPVIVDPSHATGQVELILPMSLAAAAAGADGLLIEVHAKPEQALCDGAQALTPERFQTLMQRLPAVLDAVGRHLWRPEIPAQVVRAR